MEITLSSNGSVNMWILYRVVVTLWQNRLLAFRSRIPWRQTTSFWDRRVLELNITICDVAAITITVVKWSEFTHIDEQNNDNFTGKTRCGVEFEWYNRIQLQYINEWAWSGEISSLHQHYKPTNFLLPARKTCDLPHYHLVLRTKFTVC